MLGLPQLLLRESSHMEMDQEDSTEVEGNIVPQLPTVDIPKARKIYEAWVEEHKYEIKQERKVPNWRAIPETKKPLREWFLTCNAPRDEDWAALFKDKWRGCEGSVEVGEESGIPHVHAVIYLKSAREKRTMVKLYPGWDIEERRGDQAETTSYLQGLIKGKKKSGTSLAYFLQGECKHQGKTATADEQMKNAIQMVKDGRSMEDIARTEPEMIVKRVQGLRALQDLLTEDRKGRAEVHWRWGETGVGKSEYPRKLHGEKNVYNKDNTKWWDLYENQPVCLIDDYDNESWNYRALLRFLDKYSVAGEVKGRYKKLRFTHIYITCEFPPQEYWKANKLNQVLRRLTSITHCVYDPALDTGDNGMLLRRPGGNPPDPLPMLGFR